MWTELIFNIFLFFKRDTHEDSQSLGGFHFDFVIEKNKDEQVYSLKKYASCLRATHPFDSLIEKGRQQSLPLSGKGKACTDQTKATIQSNNHHHHHLDSTTATYARDATVTTKILR